MTYHISLQHLREPLGTHVQDKVLNLVWQCPLAPAAIPVGGLAPTLILMRYETTEQQHRVHMDLSLTHLALEVVFLWS